MSLNMSKEAFEVRLKLPTKEVLEGKGLEGFEGCEGWEVPLADAKKKAKKNAKTKAQKKVLKEGNDKDLSDYLAGEYAEANYDNGKPIYPEYKNLFKAFKETAYDKVKVVILGQDPYPEAGLAHGLSFSVLETVPIPASLRKIFTELDKYFEELEKDSKKHDRLELVFERPRRGDLTAWAQQEGVLLLNAALSVQDGVPNSHKIKWKFFTDAVIAAVNDKTDPVVFVLWGRDAQKKRKLITNDIHHVLIAPHPVFNGTCETRDEDKKQPNYEVSDKFSGSEPFKKINDFLRDKRGVIDWQLK